MNPFLALKILAQKNTIREDVPQDMYLPGRLVVIFMGFIEEINM